VTSRSVLFGTAPIDRPIEVLAHLSGRRRLSMTGVRSDDDFTTRAKELLERDREILDRLAK
jgi:hypothetical protein